MKLRAATLMKALRTLIGMPREELAKYIGVSFSRYCTVEANRARMAEDEFEKVCGKFTEFIYWATLEGTINLSKLKNSPNNYYRLAAAKFEAGQIPTGYHLEDHIQ